MGFNESLLVRRSHELDELGVRIRFIGRRDWRVPEAPHPADGRIDRPDQGQHRPHPHHRLQLRRTGRAGRRRAIRWWPTGTEVTEASIESRLYDPEMPEVDLWIRTSGEHRISNFLLWQATYAELVFVEDYWPAFRRQHLADAVLEYQRRDRRFGGLNDER